MRQFFKHRRLPTNHTSGIAFPGHRGPPLPAVQKFTRDGHSRQDESMSEGSSCQVILPVVTCGTGTRDFSATAWRGVRLMCVKPTHPPTHAATASMNMSCAFTIIKASPHCALEGIDGLA